MSVHVVQDPVEIARKAAGRVNHVHVKDVVGHLAEKVRAGEIVGIAGVQGNGQSALVERLLIALLADGHLLVEGAPGLAKTRAIKSLADGLEGGFHRIQFTPDLLPGDVTGTEIYRPQEASFHFQKGPIFHNLVLADEVNRAPAKVQSALLEAMAERQVSVGSETYPLPRLFLVMATQNPIEQEGTYPLPEAQLDRFLLHVNVDYPDAAAEAEILRLTRAEANAPATSLLSGRPMSRPPVTTRTVSPSRRSSARVSSSSWAAQSSRRQTRTWSTPLRSATSRFMASSSAGSIS